MVALPALREVLAGRDFRLLFSVRLVAQFGDGLLQAALATFVLFSPERQPDAVKIAAAFAILLLPYSVIGPFAGVFLDRWRRRNVLVRANVLKALFTLPIIALVLAGNDGFLLGLAVLIVLGIGRFVLAGLSASLPHVVAGRDLVTANALTPTAGTIARRRRCARRGDAAVGPRRRRHRQRRRPGLRGRRLPRLRGHRRRHRRRPARARWHSCSRHRARRRRRPGRGHPGAAAACRRRAARSPSSACTGSRSGSSRPAACCLVRYTFNTVTDADSALNEFALLTGAAAVGAFIGAILTPWASRSWGSVPWSAAALAQAGMLGIGLIIAGAMTPSFPATARRGLSIGFAGQSVKVCSDTLVQRYIPDDHLGRVFALFDMIVNVCLVAGITLMALVSPTSGQAPWRLRRFRSADGRHRCVVSAPRPP